MRFTVLAAIVCALAYTEALPINGQPAREDAVIACSKEEPQSMFSGIMETFSSFLGYEGEPEAPEKKNPWKKIGKHEGKKWKHYGKHQKKKWAKKPKEDPPSDSEFEDFEGSDDEDIIEIKIKNPKKYWKHYGKHQKKYWKHHGKEEKKRWAPKRPGHPDYEVDEEMFAVREGDIPDGPVEDPKKHWKHYGKDQKKKWKHFGKDQKKKWSPKKPVPDDEEERRVFMQDDDSLSPPPEAPDCAGTADPKACWDDYGKEQKKYWKHYGKEQKKHWKKYGKHQKDKYGKKPDDGEGDGDDEGETQIKEE